MTRNLFVCAAVALSAASTAAVAQSPAPAGQYPEQWFLVDPSTREILYEGPQQRLLIWGLAAWTDASTEVAGGFALAPGDYQIVFALGGVMGGEAPVTTTEVASGGA